jgi:hypothetical protein
VLQHRLPAHLNHRLGKIRSELAHARTATGCEHNGSVDLDHQGGRLYPLETNREALVIQCFSKSILESLLSILQMLDN